MQGEANDAGGLSPGEEDNDAMCKSARKEWMLFIKEQYKTLNTFRKESADL